MPMYRWADLENVELNPLISGHAVEVLNAMSARIKAPKGPINMHMPDFDEITHMLAGTMRLVIDVEQPSIVTLGGALLIPADIAHFGEAHEDAKHLDLRARNKEL